MSIIPCQRHLFDIPDDRAYLDCAKMAPLSHGVMVAGRAGLEAKARPWEIEARDFFTESERVRALYARLIGVRASDVAIIPAVSYGLAIVSANVTLAGGQSIVLVAEDFPSSVFAARAMAERDGADVVTVARPVAGNWTEAVLDAIGEDAGLVVVPHVHWVCGTRFDLEMIGRRCRAVGALLVLDTTQSTGALPLDIAAVDPDYQIAAGYKWLMGPYSLGFLYVAPRHQGGRPIEQGWITRRGSEDFRRLIDYSPVMEPDARRFDMGERSNFALLPAAGAAIEQLIQWGVADIAETLGAFTEAIAARLAGRGIEAAPLEARGPHFLSVRHPEGWPDGIGGALAEAKVHVSLRGDRMRITPHLYNHDGDVDRLIAYLP